MEAQKEFVIHGIYSADAAGETRSPVLVRPSSSNSLRSLQYNFDPGTMVLEEYGSQLKVTQLGTLQRPLYTSSTKRFNSLHFSYYGPTYVPAIFFLASQLPNLKTFRYTIRIPPTEILGNFDEIQAEEFSHPGIEKIEILTDFKMYVDAEMDADIKGRVTKLCTVLLKMCGRCFQNVSKIRLELPEHDPQTYRMQRAVCKLIEDLPKLRNNEKVEVIINRVKSKVSCYYPGPPRDRRGSTSFHGADYSPGRLISVSPKIEDNANPVVEKAPSPVILKAAATQSTPPATVAGTVINCHAARQARTTFRAAGAAGSSVGSVTVPIIPSSPLSPNDNSTDILFAQHEQHSESLPNRRKQQHSDSRTRYKSGKELERRPSPFNPCPSPKKRSRSPALEGRDPRLSRTNRH